MANLMEYLEWRADVPFSLDPFNEVDNLVLSELAYTDFGGIVPPDGGTVTLAEACEAFFAQHSREEILKKTSLIAKAPLLMEEMAKGARFSGMRLCFYLNEIDREREEQFSALCYLPDDGSAFVAFRGTDNSVIGWREDFNLSFIAQTAGQQRAAAYLNEVAGSLPDPIRVGGHSKGGNFAVYAAAFCEPSLQERIETVYTNDGPGFRAELTETAGYERILPRVVSIIPDTSIIGLLLESKAEHRVVQSSASGLLQHDGFTWQIHRNRFVEADLSNMGHFLDRTLDAWLEEMDDETRKSFTDTVFSLIESTGEQNFESIYGQRWKSLEAILASMRGLPKEKRSELLRLAALLLQSGGRSVVTKQGAETR